MSEGIVPWWQRGWKDWWANQKTTLTVEDPDGRVSYDASRHEARWRGRIAATGGRWAIEICWGPGTPYFPPIVYPDGFHSGQHQLRDGALCLAPPNFTEVVEIADWLKQTRLWLAGYVRGGWGVTKEVWHWVSMFRPDPGYRLHQRPHSYLLMPFDWKPPTAQGELWACLPRGGKGLGVLRRWRAAGQRHWVEWDKGKPYIPREGEDVRGRWSSDLATNKIRSSEAFWGHAGGRNNRSLLAFPIDYGEGPSNWQFSLYDPSKVLETQRRLEQSHRQLPLANVAAKVMSHVLAHTIIEGLPMRSDELTQRTRVSRSETADDRIRNGCVVLVGLGALGSEVAHLLAKEQVGRFVLVDGDLLLPRNVARHRLDLGAVGGNKAEQMKEHIERNYPAAEVTIVPAMLDEALPSIDFPTKAVVVGLTGHIPSERVLAAISGERLLPCIHAWMESDGRVLRLLRTVPSRDPSLNEITELPPLPGSRQSLQPEECADIVLPGSAINIHAAANLVVRATLDLLCDRLAPVNHILFAPDGLDEPDTNIPEALRQRFGISACQIQKNS